MQTRARAEQDSDRGAFFLGGGGLKVVGVVLMEGYYFVQTKLEIKKGGRTETIGSSCVGVGASACIVLAAVV